MGQTFVQDQSLHLTPVPQGHADVSTLAVDPRIAQPNFAEPLGFGGLYRVEAADAFRGVSPVGEPLFARRSGGLTAVFPQSVYTPTMSGDVALIPPGTVFVIGDATTNESTSTPVHRRLSPLLERRRANAMAPSLARPASASTAARPLLTSWVTPASAGDTGDTTPSTEQTPAVNSVESGVLSGAMLDRRRGATAAALISRAASE